MRKIEAAPANMMWVTREICIWWKHNQSDRTVEISPPKHLNTVREYYLQKFGVVIM